MARLSRDDRGQFLLVGAFGIAVVLLVFAGVVNTVTFTESLATQDATPESSELTALQSDVRAGTDGLLARVNDDGVGYAATVDRLDRGVGNWSRGVGRQYAQGATAVTVSLADTARGSYVSQGTVRNLTNATGTGDWTVAENVSEVRRFRVRLDADSLASGNCTSGSCYELHLDGGRWRLAVNRSAVVVETPAGVGQCPVTADPVTIDVTGGTVDGRACQPLEYAAGVSAPYDIAFRNGTEAAGTYRLVVNDSVDTSDYDASGEPSVSPAVYAAVVEVRYRSPGLTYANRLRVAGGEPDG